MISSYILTTKQLILYWYDKEKIDVDDFAVIKRDNSGGVGAVVKISASQSWGPQFNSWPSQGLNIFGWPSFPLKFTYPSILQGSVKWVPAYMDRFEVATRGAYICFRSAGGKLIIVKCLWGYYMEKALYKCTTLLYFNCSKSNQLKCTVVWTLIPSKHITPNNSKWQHRIEHTVHLLHSSCSHPKLSMSHQKRLLPTNQGSQVWIYSQIWFLHDPRIQSTLITNPIIIMAIYFNMLLVLQIEIRYM